LQPEHTQVLSTYEEQSQRESKAVHRARDAALSQQRRIKELGKESCLPYGQLLYQLTHQALANHLQTDLEAFVIEREKAKRFAAAIPFLDQFRGPDHIATVALTAALDMLTKRQAFPSFCQSLGLAIERENRLMTLSRHSPTEMRHLMRNGMNRTKLASKETMEQLRCYEARWTSKTRLDVGAMLADAVIQSTELFTVKWQAAGKYKRRIVQPSEQAEHFVAEAKVPNYKAAHAAMVCPPRPWTGLYGGGFLGNDESLIRVKLEDIDLKDARRQYEETDLSWFFGVVNHLQATKFTVTPEIVVLQRLAWEQGIPGLFPCSRAPMEPPPRLGNDPDPAELKARNRLAAVAHRDRERNRPQRLKIERTLQLAEGLAGRDVQMSVHSDNRGRMYSGNRYVTYQGPDHEKGCLDFRNKLPVDSDAIAWILKAAAGHHSLGRASWEERLTWGYDNRDLLLAVAEDPLNRRELWAGADDPWQFLQLARGYKEAIEIGRTGVPIRLDQTSSGPGILSALVRDEKTGRLCNLWGDTRQDLYEQIAQAVVKRLQRDLQDGDTRERTLAELWLGRGITRSLVKGPVLAVPYGGSYQSIGDKLLDDLDAYLGHPPLDEFKLKVAMPSRYMAGHLWAELKDAVAPVNSVKSWLKKCCRKVMEQGHALEWNGPSGWPFLVNEREPKKTKVTSFLYGKKVFMNIQAMGPEQPLCPTRANKSLPANFTHGCDAALAHRIVCRAEEQCVELAANHDCFSCHATNAGWLHETLHETFRDLYTVDLLADWKRQIESSTGVLLPKPPMVNTLDPSEIGSNPYLFS